MKNDSTYEAGNKIRLTMNIDQWGTEAPKGTTGTIDKAFCNGVIATLETGETHVRLSREQFEVIHDSGEPEGLRWYKIEWYGRDRRAIGMFCPQPPRYVQAPNEESARTALIEQINAEGRYDFHSISGVELCPPLTRFQRGCMLNELGLMLDRWTGTEELENGFEFEPYRANPNWDNFEIMPAFAQFLLDICDRGETPSPLDPFWAKLNALEAELETGLLNQPELLTVRAQRDLLFDLLAPEGSQARQTYYNDLGEIPPC